MIRPLPLLCGVIEQTGYARSKRCRLAVRRSSRTGNPRLLASSAQKQTGDLASAAWAGVHAAWASQRPQRCCGPPVPVLRVPGIWRTEFRINEVVIASAELEVTQ